MTAQFRGMVAQKAGPGMQTLLARQSNNIRGVVALHVKVGKGKEAYMLQKISHLLMKP